MNFIKVIAYVQFLILMEIVLGIILGNSKYWVLFYLVIIVELFVCGVVLLKHNSIPNNDDNKSK